MKFSIGTSRRVPALVAGIAVGAVVTGGIAYAAIPATDGTVRACYAKTGNLVTAKGTVRIVDQNEACKSNEVAIAWNQAGQKGDPGPGGAGTPESFRLEHHILTEGETLQTVPVEPGASYLVQAHLNIARASISTSTQRSEVACAYYLRSSTKPAIGIDASVSAEWVRPNDWQGFTMPLHTPVVVPADYTDLDLRCYGSLFGFNDITNEGWLTLTKVADAS